MSKRDIQFIDHLKAPYLPLYHKYFPMTLFWTPKSGCTTLNRWFFFQLGLFDDVSHRSGGEVHRYRNDIFTKETEYSSILIESLLAEKQDTYKLVRNPYRRAVSSFLSTICSPWLISMFHGDLNRGMSFKQFLYYLKNLGSEISSVDPHIGLQYINGEEHFIKNYIYLENFSTHIRDIENKYGLLEAPLSEITKSPHHFAEKMVKKGEFAEMIMTMGIFDWSFPTYESLYNQETKDLVREIYRKDFEAYGYDQDDLKLASTVL
ncbi:hypothetical protein EHS13_35585 [Paenibacillus psychroresistens]|uniref:Sulfotransferase family protein n=1 Tax=Paenibacillus psychroresistens TaxID=1778678 RepID=A0A6B8RVB8_9BACL|nr:sulfotransferase family 2 domain-containing protein [Paenibacillus psychroresistens]QGQ99812.1 hypothetical protein EHS13_35585 [Paenibacillus psychroresistens]